MLTGALELRNPVDPDQAAPMTASPDVITSMTAEMFFDYIALHVKGLEASELKYSFNIVFPDIDEQYALYLENGVLNYSEDKLEPLADTTIFIDRSDLNEIILNPGMDLVDLDLDSLHYSGDIGSFQEFLSYLDEFEFWFGVVTP